MARLFSVVFFMLFAFPALGAEPVDHDRFIARAWYQPEPFSGHRFHVDNSRRHSQRHLSGKRTHAYAAREIPQTHERVWAAISKPVRYIAGRLICARNVNAALAERGIKGTGSALAASFRTWGRASGPTPGAVAFNWRRGGGHVSIVAKVEGGTVYVWNPSPRGQGWQLRVNPYHSEYRVASQ